MPEDQHQLENLEIEPLSEEDLEGVTGGNGSENELVGGDPRSCGGECCSCSACSG